MNAMGNCDECGTEFHGYGEHRGRNYLVDTAEDGSQTVIGRFCSMRCLATFANRRADEAEANRDESAE